MSDDDMTDIEHKWVNNTLINETDRLIYQRDQCLEKARNELDRVRRERNSCRADLQNATSQLTLSQTDRDFCANTLIVVTQNLNKCTEEMKQSTLNSDREEEFKSLTEELENTKNHVFRCTDELRKCKLKSDRDAQKQIDLIKNKLSTCSTRLESTVEKINKCTEELNLGKANTAQISDRLENVTNQLSLTKRNLDQCNVQLTSNGDMKVEVEGLRNQNTISNENLKTISRITAMSDIYILPYSQKFSVRESMIDSVTLKLDRFKFNVNHIIAEGSFGKIYGGKSIIPSSDPLNVDGNTPNYVVKIINVDTEDGQMEFDDMLRESSVELNIQNIIYNIGIRNIKIPYIYRKIFYDKLTNSIGFISELVKSENVSTMISGYNIAENNNTVRATRLNDGASYTAFKRCVLLPLNTLYNDMNNGNTQIKFKHNDSHAGNILLRIIDNSTIEPVFIDYGLSTIKSIYDMNIDNDIVNYIHRSKIDTYLRAYHGVPPRKTRTVNVVFEVEIYLRRHSIHTSRNDIISECSRYLTRGRMSDYHLYVLSVCGICIYTNTIIHQITDERLKNSIKESIMSNGWDQFVKDVLLKYKFLEDLSVSGNTIRYKNSIIPRKSDFNILYGMMIPLIRNDFFKIPYGNSIPPMIADWNITEWRTTTLFIEFYMKDADPTVYNMCTTPF